MNHFLAGFLKEASALGALKGLGKATVKNPLLVLGAGATAIGTGVAARSAYKSGRRGDEKPRYLAASYDPISGRAMPSRAALTNFNPLFREKLSPKKRKALSKHYKEKAFKG